jgi:hypothetical protein
MLPEHLQHNQNATRSIAGAAVTQQATHADPIAKSAASAAAVKNPADATLATCRSPIAISNNNSRGTIKWTHSIK